jgi:hypothetical protein
MRTFLKAFCAALIAAIFVAVPALPQTPVVIQAGTSGGCTAYHLAGGTTASTNSNLIKAGAGTLCDLVVTNTTAVIYYVRLYDLAVAPTCSSATGVKHVFPIQIAANDGLLVRPIPLGESYAAGIGFCVTAAGTDTDNTNAATGVYVEASYK